MDAANNPTHLPNTMSLEAGHSGSKAPNSPSAVDRSPEAGDPVPGADDSILKVDGPVSHEAILAASEPELVAFLDKCHVRDRRFDISSIVGLGHLPVETRNMVGDKLNAAVRKVYPLETDRLNALLLENLDKEYELKPRNRDEESTLTPTASYNSEADALERAAEAHAGLVQAGGIPVLQISDVGPPRDMTRENRHKAAMWLEIPKESQLAYTELLPVFSAQLEHWEGFQQYWQWGNRGDAGRETGLSLFLVSRLRDHLDFSGKALNAKSAAWYDKVDRQEWQRNQPQYTASRANSETFASYAEAMENRLKSYNFTRPYHLLEDPREQDAWTTAVEYLNYIYWEAERDASRMKAAEPKYRQTMDSLLGYTGFAVPWFERNAAKALPTQLQEAEDAWRALFDKIESFREGVTGYLEHEANLRRDRQRSEWLLEQLASMEKGIASEKDALASIEQGVASAEQDKVALIEGGEATCCAKQGVDSIDQAAASSSKEEAAAISSKEDAAAISGKEEEPASVEKGSAAPVKEDLASFKKEMLASIKEELASFKKKADTSMKDEFSSLKKEILASVKEELALFKGEADTSVKEGLASVKKEADTFMKEELASFKKDILTSLEKEHASFLKVATASTAEELASFKKSAATSGEEEQDLEEPRPANTEDERQESAHATATKAKGVPGNNKQQPKKRKRNEGDDGSGKADAQDTEVATAPPARISRAGSSKSCAPATKIPQAADVSEQATAIIATPAAAAPKRTLRGRRQSPERGDEDGQAGAADGAGAGSTARPSQKRKQNKRQKTAR